MNVAVKSFYVRRVLRVSDVGFNPFSASSCAQINSARSVWEHGTDCSAFVWNVHAYFVMGLWCFDWAVLFDRSHRNYIRTGPPTTGRNMRTTYTVSEKDCACFNFFFL